MYLLIVFLPLLSSITAGLFGRFLGSKGSSIITVTLLFFNFLISLLIFYEIGFSKSFVYIKLGTWINSDILNIDWGFLFDSLTAIMCCTVTFISFLVHLYSVEYMSHDPHLPRFMSYLSLFTFFMIILVTADNFVQMFVGWEGVGLCSYLLINFWFTRIQANKAAIKAMIINRIGDFGLMLGILTIFIYFKAVDYSTVFALVPLFYNTSMYFFNIQINVLTLIGILLFIGAIGKSAQLGLHTWLPDAMEGPTPVSALIHAATMVTAGVFLLARSSIIFEYAPITLVIITFFGAATSFFAATTGLLQNDIKRVIAYSTCSQLGYMVFACGLSNYSIGIFHLVNHAFFKALLFLSAGAIIHAMSNEQDMRKMGGLKHKIPFAYSIMVIGSLSLTGFPFLTGFYSKDIILESAYGKYSNISHFSYLLGTLGAFLTAFYSARLLYLVFLTKPNSYKIFFLNVKESSYFINFSLILLAIPSIFAGFFLKDILIGVGTDFWGNSLFVLPENMNLIDSEFINIFYKLLPIFLSIIAIFINLVLYTYYKNKLYVLKINFFGNSLYNFLNKKWYFDKIYNEIIAQTLLKFSYRISYKIIDRGIIEILGPYGLGQLINKKAFYLYKLQSGILYHYTLSFLIFSSLFLCMRQFWLNFAIYIDFRLFVIFILMCFFIVYLNYKK
uniref:NADH-ubiquinone oxidoreductase chain 5 n=1 Tax=Melosira undulata TaxID=2133757 RepID=A0A3G1PWE2_9STRA|nr:NADH dehydrogenase subunit 5 [Melosira undulata]AVR57549.1 NADH dehydrogenase subunit 5 [Melosira undulata]